MNKKVKLICALLAFAGVLVLAKFGYDALQKNYGKENELANAPQEETEYQQAIDFTVYDAEENPIKLSSFIGKPIVLSFWASWCPNCVNQMPGFNQVHEAYGDKVTFLMINVTDGQQETVKSAKAYMESKDYTLPYYFDTELEASSIYQANAIPITYLINAEGYLIAYGKGAISAESLQTTIDSLFAQE